MCLPCVINNNMQSTESTRSLPVDSPRASIAVHRSLPVYQSTTQSTVHRVHQESTGVHRVDGGLFTPQPALCRPPLPCERARVRARTRVRSRIHTYARAHTHACVHRRAHSCACTHTHVCARVPAQCTRAQGESCMRTRMHAGIHG